eukprot:CAMPEP_0204292620 /NCGR_PEP_ID=MMETSP0468-20130131/64709_1 /ASSEMBLY_ACC=CAM_ASM_000383 /TAXON_ID=2969 /ORGANISM="Oxyrrhis marina" /LENGTH=49 /DNA_ID= /DNA_START= /DNA_END= /DNA_ORIENTATION=
MRAAEQVLAPEPSGLYPGESSDGSSCLGKLWCPVASRRRPSWAFAPFLV